MLPSWELLFVVVVERLEYHSSLFHYIIQGVVISTATNSQFGEIMKLMILEESPKTPLQNSMDELGKQLSLYSFGVIILIFVIGLIQGRNVLDMFTIGVRFVLYFYSSNLDLVWLLPLSLKVFQLSLL